MLDVDIATTSQPELRLFSGAWSQKMAPVDLTKVGKNLLKSVETGKVGFEPQLEAFES